MTEVAAKYEIISKLLNDPSSVPELRPFPAVATRVVSACRDPATPLREVASIIECDPAYASKLLRMANSSVYGLTGSIRTVKQALVVLGLRQVRNLALTLAGAELFDSSAGGQKWLTDLWEHSLGCAAVARVLAGLTGRVDPEEAFLAGIFHDTGKLVMSDLLGGDYDECLNVEHDEELCRLEESRFGTTHAQVGERCGEFWGLPPEVTGAIGMHHQMPQPEDIEQVDLATCLAAADQLCRCWQIGPGTDMDPDGQYGRSLIAAMHLEPDEVEEICTQSRAVFEELKNAVA